jgi:hypothetical protein
VEILTKQMKFELFNRYESFIDDLACNYVPGCDFPGFLFDFFEEIKSQIFCQDEHTPVNDYGKQYCLYCGQAILNKEILA